MEKIQESSIHFCYRCRLKHPNNLPCIGTPCWFCNEIVLNNPVGICKFCMHERCPQLKKVFNSKTLLCHQIS